MHRGRGRCFSAAVDPSCILVIVFGCQRVRGDRGEEHFTFIKYEHGREDCVRCFINAFQINLAAALYADVVGQLNYATSYELYCLSPSS